MLAPVDKIRNGGNDIIQIVVTRSCSIFTCSNCTQLLPFRKDVLHMSVDCFREAVRSLDGWPGVRAIFGGNPCNHPEFDKLCGILAEEVPDQRKRGLWTNDLLRHGAVAKETFWPHGRFNLNVHANSKAADAMREWLPGIPIYGESGAIHHAGMMLDRKDYNLSEGEWVSLRERCDINQKWSSGIYQGADGRPYAYFCEVAGSLSGVRGENNGILATPGWWQKPMSEFADQVRTCCDRGCGVPLKGRGHQDSEDTYDISPSWVELTTDRIGKAAVQCHDERPAMVHENTDYIGRKLAKTRR